MNDQQFSLFELQQSVKNGLDDIFPLPVWVKAEISEMTVNRSGHCYLDLIETETGNGYGDCTITGYNLVVHLSNASALF